MEYLGSQEGATLMHVHDWLEYEDRKGYRYRACRLCHAKDCMIPNGPDDFEWSEVEEGDANES